LRHWPTFFAGAVCVVLLVAAIDIERSQRKLAAVSEERLVASEQSVASDIARIHGQLQKDAARLAGSPEVESYFVNLDLGMSRLYGLNANLEFIETLFRKNVSASSPSLEKPFQRIALFDGAGELLATSRSAGDWAAYRIDRSAETPRIDAADRTIQIRTDVVVRGRSRGTLVAIANIGLLSLPIRPGTAADRDLRFVLFGDGQIVQDQFGNPVTDAVLLSLVSRLLEERTPVIRTLSPDGPFGNMLGVIVQVPGTPVSLMSLTPRTAEHSALARDNTGAFLIALAIVILVATLVVSKMERRAARLQTEFEMSQKHRANLQRKNTELSDEMYRRQMIARDLKAKSEELDRINADLRIAATAFETQEGMVVLDLKGGILRANAAFSRLVEGEPETLPGRNLKDIVSADGSQQGSFLNSIGQGTPWKGDVSVPGGGDVAVSRWLTLSPVRNDDDETTHQIGTFYDLSDIRQAEDQIRTLAFYDQLTGLPNRPLLTDRTVQAMRINAQSGEFGAIMFIDLDRFKKLNDTLGHDVGDKLLKQVGSRISAEISQDSTVARFGGDEFVVLAPNLKTDQEREAVFLAEDVADRILGSFDRPFQLDGYEHTCSASIGIALFSGQFETLEDVLKRADIAMYEAKGAGRNTIRFFDPEMQRVVAEEASLETDIRAAVETGGFRLQFQPQVNAAGWVVGAEVLLRWPHPSRGFVSPAEFVPIAEKTGLIVPIGNWVMQTAFERLVDWGKDDCFGNLDLSINVSATQLHNAEFVETVLAAIKHSGARPERVKLEITESLLVRNMDEAIRKMDVLQDHGIRFSLDDFGTGYSSLSYLKQLPLDQLKIDQSFVRGLPGDGDDAAIAEMVVALGRTLGLNVIAEGVETEDQRAFLEGIGCDQFQGYLFGKPMAITRFDEFVRATNRNIRVEDANVRNPLVSTMRKANSI